MPDRARQSGSAGRFGPRYGSVARHRVKEIEGSMREDHTCPACGDDKVSRDGTGIWECSGCNYRFAGGTFQPTTPAGGTVKRSIRAALADEGNDE